jgi:hypothetical protein
VFPEGVDSSDVPARPREAGNQAFLDWIGGDAPHDDRDRGRRLLGSPSRLYANGENTVHFEPDDLGRQAGKHFDVALRKASLDDEVLSLDVTQFAQGLNECLVLSLDPGTR